MERVFSRAERYNGTRMITFGRLLPVICLVVIASGCHPWSIRYDKFDSNPPHRIAVLPIARTSLVALSERIPQLRNDIISELREKGYQVLESDLVDEVCSDAACDHLNDLQKAYGID